MINYNELPADARVWIYQSNKSFDEQQTAIIQKKVENFIQQWQSHGKGVKAWGKLQYNRFIILIADQNHEAPSGCSIDSSVAFIKSIATEMGVDMFDRMNFAYKKEGKVLSADRLNFANLYQSGSINDQTTVFNNLVNTKADLDQKWELPLAESWHARMV